MKMAKCNFPNRQSLAYEIPTIHYVAEKKAINVAAKPSWHIATALSCTIDKEYWIAVIVKQENLTLLLLLREFIDEMY